MALTLNKNIMTQEQFLQLKQEKRNQIEILNQEIKDLNFSYIQEHKKFDIDEKVILGKGTKNERFAFIRSVEIGYRGEIEYKCDKAKKDGNRSLHSDYCYGNTIDKID